MVVGLIVGFVAIALVSAMYGVFNQVQVEMTKRPPASGTLEAGYTLTEVLARS